MGFSQAAHKGLEDFFRREGVEVVSRPESMAQELRIQTHCGRHISHRIDDMALRGLSGGGGNVGRVVEDMKRRLMEDVIVKEGERPRWREQMLYVEPVKQAVKAVKKAATTAREILQERVDEWLGVEEKTKEPVGTPPPVASQPTMLRATMQGRLA